MRENAGQKNHKFRHFSNIDKKIKLSCQFYSVGTVFSDKNKFYFNDFVSNVSKKLFLNLLNEILIFCCSISAKYNLTNLRYFRAVHKIFKKYELLLVHSFQLGGGFKKFRQKYLYVFVYQRKTEIN